MSKFRQLVFYMRAFRHPDRGTDFDLMKSTFNFNFTLFSTPFLVTIMINIKKKTGRDICVKKIKDNSGL